MKLYILKGTRNSGKTTSLKKLWNLLINKDFEEIHCEYIDNNPKDFFVTLRKGRKTICICSAADDTDRIKDARNYFVAQNCDIGISACHTYGDTVDKWNRLRIANSWEITFIDKISLPIEEVNEKDAERVFLTIFPNGI